MRGNGNVRVCLYILAANGGFAPNPFFGWSTLACCKPAIRRRARAGDRVVGLTPKADGHRLRRDLCPRPAGWRPVFGQIASAHGHLRKQGVTEGDLFLFWGLFRRIDEESEWVGRPEHHIWGWTQVGRVVPVDDVMREGGAEWAWARSHPHLHFSPDPTKTLYVATDQLRLSGVSHSIPGAGAFGTTHATRRLTCETARTASEWCLPETFKPRPDAWPLTYHADPARWSRAHRRVHLRAVSRGQEFVLDLDEYPAVRNCVAEAMAPA